MIVFIDDLDRCRPDQVVDMLEAINFVVSSGDCYVILGMAPSRVEPCIAIAFKDVFDEIAALKTGERVEAETEKRGRLAREYLDKLVNIEVQVPRLEEDGALRLLVPSAEGDAPATDPPATPRFERALRWLAEIERPGPMLMIAALAMLGGTLGWWCAADRGTPPAATANFTDGHAATSSEETATVIADASENADGEAIAGPKLAAGVPGGQAAGAGAPTSPVHRARDGQTPHIAEGKPGCEAVGVVSISAVDFAVVVVGLGMFVLAALSARRPDPVVRDSAEFTKALAIWRSVVFARRRTPRSFKRFLNRVRYMAMRQRRLARSRTGWESLLGPAKAAPGRQDAGADTDTDTDTGADTSRDRAPPPGARYSPRRRMHI